MSRRNTWFKQKVQLFEKVELLEHDGRKVELLNRRWLWLVPAGLVGLLLVLVLLLRRAVRKGGLLVRPVKATDYIQEPDVPAQLQRQPDGSLLIQWRESSSRVSLHAGDRPETIDWQTALMVVEEGQQARLTGRDPSTREYFGLQFADGTRRVVAERTLPLEGNGNFRDLGGYLTADGRITRWGRVFRSSTLARLTDNDLAYLERMGLRLVCDFRSEAEMARDPDRVPAGADYRPMPIVSNNPITRAINTILFNRHQLGDLMQDSYFRLVDEGAAEYGRALALLADEDNFPLVVHCAAGKDRAGVAAALILKAVGVPDETILADYSLSNHIFDFLTGEFADEMSPFTRLGIPFEHFHHPLVADPAWLAAILRHIEDHYSGIEAYLTGPAGLSPETLAAIRLRFVKSLEI